MGAPSSSVALTGADQAVRTTPGFYRGYTVVETGGSNPATVRIYDHASAASGTLIGAVNLAAGGSADVHCDAVAVASGVYVDVGGTGTVAGSVRIG